MFAHLCESRSLNLGFKFDRESAKWDRELCSLILAAIKFPQVRHLQPAKYRQPTKTIGRLAHNKWLSCSALFPLAQQACLLYTLESQQVRISAFKWLTDPLCSRLKEIPAGQLFTLVEDARYLFYILLLFCSTGER